MLGHPACHLELRLTRTCEGRINKDHEGQKWMFRENGIGNDGGRLGPLGSQKQVLGQTLAEVQAQVWFTMVNLYMGKGQ